MSGGDEFTIIRDLMAPLAHHPGARRLADDGAVLTASSGMDLAVTKDMMIEGVHFLPDDPADLVARKLLRANLSDLAAMGAEPCGYLLGLASDGRRDRPWLEDFAGGLARDQEEYGISLLGGDTVAAQGGLLTLSVTAFGEVPAGMSFARERARKGDVVAVTGTIGDAALGLLVRTGALHGSGTRPKTGWCPAIGCLSRESRQALPCAVSFTVQSTSRTAFWRMRRTSRQRPESPSSLPSRPFHIPTPPNRRSAMIRRCGTGRWRAAMTTNSS